MGTSHMSTQGQYSQIFLSYSYPRHKNVSTQIKMNTTYVVFYPRLGGRNCLRSTLLILLPHDWAESKYLKKRAEGSAGGISYDPQSTHVSLVSLPPWGNVGESPNFGKRMCV